MEAMPEAREPRADPVDSVVAETPETPEVVLLKQTLLRLKFQ